MTTKKDLIDNELIRTIFYAKIDSLWHVLDSRKKGKMPREDKEKATGDIQDKGAIFVPGGFVYETSDQSPIKKEAFSNQPPSAGEFRELVLGAMRYDLATLLYQDGIAQSVNLNNGDLFKSAMHIACVIAGSIGRGEVLPKNPPREIFMDDISKSYCPAYIEAPYGSRISISSALAVITSFPRRYFLEAARRYNLRDQSRNDFWGSIRDASEAIQADDGTLLAPPFVVACHTQRYKPEIYTGITRILGIGKKFGEFATLTLEDATTSLLNELSGERTHFSEDEKVAEYNGSTIVAVVRIYPGTTAGKRSPRTTTYLVAPERDLGLNLAKITQEAMARYDIRD